MYKKKLVQQKQLVREMNYMGKIENKLELKHWASEIKKELND